MKFFAVFAAVLALSAAAPTTQWTLHDLTQALESSATPAAMIPYLEQALNAMMESTFAGQPIGAITVPTPAGLLPVEAVNPVVAAPTTQWTLNDLNIALQSPATPAALIPYLEHALNEMMEAIFAGQPIAAISVPTPAGLLPVEAVSPIAVMPVDVVEVGEPVAPVVAAEPTPVVVADASGSPLVQIIVNIKSQEAAAEMPAAVESPAIVAPSPAVVPSPIIVVPDPAVVPSPVIVAPEVNPIDIISITPVAPGPAVVPSPVIVAPEVNPIDIISITPVAPGPAVVPSPVIVVPESNPLDLLQPVPVAVAGGASQGIQA